MIKAEEMFGVMNSLMNYRHLIESALARQQGEGFTFDHIYDLVATHKVLFFWNEDSCAVIEIRSYPGETSLHVFLGAGTTEGLLKLYDGVSKWGSKAVGATKMTTLCRKGFKRRLREHGWKEKQVWLTKEIAA